MWLFARFGFFSVVVDKDNPGYLLVRARMPGGLETLKSRYLPELGPIAETPERDYRFRASVRKQAFTATVSSIAEDITYANFKDEVKHVQGDRRAAWYADVWSVMYEMQSQEEKSEGGRTRPKGK